VGGPLPLHRLEHLVEALARKGLGMRAAIMKRGRLAVGAGLSLIRESHVLSDISIHSPCGSGGTE
jgi:hypothetical protein